VEHRCGHRRQVGMRVTLYTRSGVVGEATICEISASGARLQCCLPLWSQSVVGLQFLTPLESGQRIRQRVEAEVVRQTEDGFAIEWLQFAPEAVSQLLQLAPPEVALSPPALPPATVAGLASSSAPLG